MFSAVPRIADILDGLRFGSVGMQQARLLFTTDHYANALMGERRRRQRLIRFRLFPRRLETGSFSTHSLSVDARTVQTLGRIGIISDGDEIVG